MPLNYHSFMTPLLDYKDGEGIFLKPRSILRMRMEKDEVPWSELRFDTNLKITHFRQLGTMLLSDSVISHEDESSVH